MLIPRTPEEREAVVAFLLKQSGRFPYEAIKREAARRGIGWDEFMETSIRLERLWKVKEPARRAEHIGKYVGLETEHAFPSAPSPRSLPSAPPAPSATATP